MTLDQLVVFIKIVDLGSYRQAAEALFRSQPALTQAIKKLEDELNIELFSRDTYRPTLTPAGTIFVKHARRAVDEMQHLKVLGMELGKTNEPYVRIALDIICPSNNIVHIANQVLAEYSPNTELVLYTEVLSGGRERLLSNAVDMAIMPLHSHHPELYAEPLIDVNMVPVCAPGYLPILHFKSERELRQYRQIILSDSAKTSQKISDGVINDAMQWVVTDIYLKKSIIMQGLGWGYLPEHMITEEMRAHKIVKIQIGEELNHKIPISLIRHNLHPMGPLSKRIWEALRNNMRPQIAVGST